MAPSISKAATSKGCWGENSGFGSVFGMNLECVWARESCYVIAAVMSLNEITQEKNLKEKKG